MNIKIVYKKIEIIYFIWYYCFIKFVFLEDNVIILVFYYINENMMEIVYKDNIEIWKGCYILNYFVEVNGFEIKKILFDFFEKNF